ncbi:hypothetical protein M0R72_08510 [Candidatus Pacearchaeota archaeon]|jgi:hypothetical protein|nr:hypothetical protein [Candidatus Pacearchaeota archaeon]
MKLLSFPHDAYLVTEAAVSLFDGTLTASPTIGAWPSGVTGRCKVTISSVTGHTDVAGTITIGTETLTFIQAGIKQTTVNLTAKPTVTSSGLDCHCHITVVDTGGADVVAETLTAIKIRFEPTSKMYMNATGAWTQSQAYAMVVNSTIKINDIIRYNSTDYPVKQIEAFNWLDGIELYRILYF